MPVIAIAEIFGIGGRRDELVARSVHFAGYQFELSGLLARPSEMTVYSVTDTLRPVAGGLLDPRDAD